MFSNVIAEAKEYTRSVVTFYRMTDGRVESNIGTYVHLDDDGHILSASHIFKMGSEDPISTISVILDGRYFSADYIADDIPNDIILLKIRDFKPGSIKAFPKFLNGSTGELPRGTPLVRLGYPKGHPHSNFSVIWDEAINGFRVDEKNTRVTCYHNDGILTGYENRENGVRLLEMSTPALMGQSGGPVLTANGAMAGLQSRNTGYEFEAETGRAATHIAIAKLLEKHNLL